MEWRVGAMLRGHESLIRLVGKRQRYVTLQDAVASQGEEEQSREAEEEKEKESQATCNWVQCPVCGKQIRGSDDLVNCHLDFCLENGNKRRKTVQSTLFQFKSVKDKNAGLEKCDLEGPQPLSNCTDSNLVVEPDAFGFLVPLPPDCMEESDDFHIAKWHEIVSTGTTQNEDEKTCVLFTGSFETRLAGRKYNKEVECTPGMQVNLVREPENPKDQYAIKVLSMDGLRLGHVPKVLSVHLFPLIDQNVVSVEGYVSDDVSGNISESARLVLHCREIKSRTIGTAVEEQNLAVCWKSFIDAADSARDSGNYQKNFLCMLEMVLYRDSHLFSSSEIELLESFRSLSLGGQRLFLRLAQRKGPWFRLQHIFYKDVEDIKFAVHELLDKHYLTGSVDIKSSDMLDLLTVPELKDFIRSSNLMAKGAALSLRRDQLITNINDALVSLSDPLLSSISRQCGPCVRISETAALLFWRLQRLFFLNGEQELNMFLLVDIGRVKYPVYKCTRKIPVFASRNALLAYEQALQLAQVVDMALEANEADTLSSCFRKARNELAAISANAEVKHPFLARFSAAWVYTTICTVAVSFLERERKYTDAVELLTKLLGMQYCPGRRGHWTLRLSVDLEHLQRLEKSLTVAENGLNDSNIRGGDRIALQRRVLRLGKPPRRWKIPSFAAIFKKKQKMVTIAGRPLNSTAGMKSRFYGYDDQQCGVEELALQYYAGEEGGGWKGVHSESGIWLTLFGLLMWDVIFCDVPDVFQTPFQIAPLDLDTDTFYSVRRSQIETRLQSIRNGDAKKIISKTWEGNCRTLCSGVNWEYSVEDLQTIADCIGGSGLSAICKLLAEDRANWSAGMPDLLLWKEKEAKLAEVKGPGDRLSEQQLAWFFILSDAGIPVELCKVSKPT